MTPGAVIKLDLARACALVEQALRARGVKMVMLHDAGATFPATVSLHVNSKVHAIERKSLFEAITDAAVRDG